MSLYQIIWIPLSQSFGTSGVSLTLPVCKNITTQVDVTKLSLPHTAIRFMSGTVYIHTLCLYCCHSSNVYMLFVSAVAIAAMNIAGVSKQGAYGENMCRCSVIYRTLPLLDIKTADVFYNIVACCKEAGFHGWFGE